MDEIAARDVWSELKKHTNARIALGRTGNSLPTQEILQFKLSHALARDAVLRPFDAKKISMELNDHGIASVIVHSQALDRKTYLENPNLGRKLSLESQQALALQSQKKPIEMALIVADGLSTDAVHTHAVPCILELKSQLKQTGLDPSLVVIANQARVALGDPIGEILKSKVSVVLIGERPGLSSPDSLSCYLTWHPKQGLSDAERNCISNINANGLSCVQAAYKIKWLLSVAEKLGCTGIKLKDESAEDIVKIS